MQRLGHAVLTAPKVHSEDWAWLEALPPDTLVLPSHGLPFKGLHTRIDQLQAHHAERFAEALEACAEAPQSAFELVPVRVGVSQNS